jgi:hypothetical protein
MMMMIKVKFSLQKKVDGVSWMVYDINFSLLTKILTRFHMVVSINIYIYICTIPAKCRAF